MKKSKKKVSSASSAKKTKTLSSSVSKSVQKPSAVKTQVSGEAYVSGKTRILPLADRILIRPTLPAELETKNDFGIIIPDTVTKERPEQGTVVAVGEGRTENGVLVPMKVRVGDTVIFSKYGFDEVKVGGNELYILKEDSILAVVRE